MADLISHFSSKCFFYPSLSTSRIHSISCCLTSNQPTPNNLNLNLNLKCDGTTAADHRQLRIIFAAGGTGGHISPAVAIADQFKALNPNTQILFLGTASGMESTAVPSAGYHFDSVPAPQLAQPFINPINLLFPYRLIISMIECWHIIAHFDPHVLVGTGGYVSFPICLTAALKGIKLVIQEQNSVPGTANWLLSYLANAVFVAYNSTVDCFPKNKCVVCGNPVRSSLQQNVSKDVARSYFFPNSDKTTKYSENKKVLLILGGSFGANAINIAMLNLYYQMLLENNNLFLIWQTGNETFNEMESLVKNHPRLLLTPFLQSMDMAYAAADLIVSRAGAMTCSEILTTGTPTIFIPSPNVGEGHQFKNASLMADLIGSKVISEDELDSLTLGIAIQEILEDDILRASMCERALKAAKPNAAGEITNHIIDLVSTLKS